MAKVGVDPVEVKDEKASIPVPDIGTTGTAGAEIPLASSPQPDQPAKRGRGRPRKGETPPPAPSVTPEDLARTKAAFALTFGALGTVAAGMRGEHWRLQQEECDKLGEAWAAVVAPFLPRVGPAVPIVAAVIVTAGVFAPRIQEDIRMKKARALTAPKKEEPKEGAA